MGMVRNFLFGNPRHGAGFDPFALSKAAKRAAAREVTAIYTKWYAKYTKKNPVWAAYVSLFDNEFFLWGQLREALPIICVDKMQLTAAVGEKDHAETMVDLHVAIMNLGEDLKKAGYLLGANMLYHATSALQYYHIEEITTEKYNEMTKRYGKMIGMPAANESAHINCKKLLTEAGIEVDSAYFMCLDEASQIQVSEDTLTGMMKFITDKYNSLDFAEIERSAGDITRFKYAGMLQKNAQMLKDIYDKSPDPGAKKYSKVADGVLAIINHLEQKRGQYSNLYKSGNGLVQLMYTSMVAACVYSIGILVSNTIRFVTTEQDTDCQVMYDEIPGSAKNVHIKNVLSAANSLGDFSKVLDAYDKGGSRSVNEAAFEVIGAGLLAVAGIIYLIPKILVLIREIIYSIYFLRVKMSDMLALQIDLLNTNIEALETRGENPKIIAKQSKVVQKLEKWKNRISMKVDSVNTLVVAQRRKETQALRVEPTSPVARAPEDFDTTSLMI